MEAGKPSQTAISAALFRASHLHLFDSPKIHEDSLALDLSGIGGPDQLRAFSAVFAKMNFPLRRFSAYFALRQRIAEERMKAALEQGTEQVVLLGAGLDSFALRNPVVPRAIRFVEVDHPASQLWKRERLMALGLDTPGVRYVPVDFATQNLGVELASAGIDPARPVFVTWLGVTQYIDEDATHRTLSLLAEHAAGTEVVFDLVLPIDLQPPDEQEITRASAEAGLARGEPWVSYIAPAELEARLAMLGFRRIERTAGKDADSYYAGQPVGVRPLSSWQIVSAQS